MLPECNNITQIYLELNYASYCHSKITTKNAVSQFSQLSIQGSVKKKTVKQPRLNTNQFIL